MEPAHAARTPVPRSPSPDLGHEGKPLTFKSLFFVSVYSQVFFIGFSEATFHQATPFLTLFIQHNFSNYTPFWDWALGTIWRGDDGPAQERYARGRASAEKELMLEMNGKPSDVSVVEL